MCTTTRIGSNYLQLLQRLRPADREVFAVGSDWPDGGINTYASKEAGLGERHRGK